VLIGLPLGIVEVESTAEQANVMLDVDHDRKVPTLEQRVTGIFESGQEIEFLIEVVPEVTRRLTIGHE
jgi:hypothetical protein